MNSMSTAETRPAYLAELIRAGADRVFICPRNSFRDDSRRAEILEQLRRNINFYRENGLETGVWFGGFGHGGTLNPTDENDSAGFTRIVGLSSGASADDSFCPLDTDFRNAYYSFVKAAAALHPDLIMIDDDLRLSLHGPAGIGCACHLHMEEFSRRIGHEVTREELQSKVFAGGTNEYRQIWLGLMRDTMLDFAHGLREAVESADANVRLGHCACIPTWDTDGADSIEISRVLSGSGKSGSSPFLRLIGAPYWNRGHAFGTVSLGEIVELERMQLDWCKTNAPEIEVFTECDAYPRPRYVVPSSYLECFDAALTASGSNGILKYMFDYNQTPLYETGYVDRHVKNTPERLEIARLAGGGEAAGIRVFERMHKLAGTDFDGIAPDSTVIGRFFSPALKLCALCSMPVAYGGKYPTMVFGENARVSGAELAGLTDSPLILDVVSAEILSARGIDTGLCAAEKMRSGGFEYFRSERIPISQNGGLYRLTINPSATVLSGFDSEMKAPSAYTYENSAGQKFLVYAFSAAEVNPSDALFCSYERQKQLAEAYEWLGGKPLCAYLPKNPKLHIIAEKTADGMSVFLGNFNDDEILSPSVKLDENYSDISFTGKHMGKLDGNFVRFETDIPAYSFACFKVTYRR